MTAPLESWKVLPHGQLTDVGDNADPRDELRRLSESLR